MGALFCSSTIRTYLNTKIIAYRTHPLLSGLTLQGFANPAVANPGVTAALSPLTTGLSAIQQGLTALSGAISGFDSGLVSALSGALGVAGFPSFTDLNALGGLANEALGLLGQVLPVG